MHNHLDCILKIIISFLLIVFWALPVSAAKYAFVVGNSDYLSVTKLPNPKNDASDMAKKLSDLGYDVELAIDLPKNKFLTKFQTFLNTLQNEDIAIFYYAGHGLQIGGENYLIPIDAIVKNEKAVQKELITLNSILADLSRKTNTRIIILDACRNNPFKEKIERSLKARSAANSLSRGFARVYAGVGSFIAFSTQPGNIAEDGDARNSPFTQSLLRHMETTDSDVHDVLRKVRADVKDKSQGRQIPWENSSLIKKVTFKYGAISENNIQKKPSLPSPQLRLRSYHYTGGLDPYGDNFLSLRNGPGSNYQQIATMGPNTPLEILGRRGKWQKVILADGTTGWAFGKYIKCCKPFPVFNSGVETNPKKITRPNDCEELWVTRNQIWKNYGYCFKSKKAKNYFGNRECYRNLSQASANMSYRDKAKVKALSKQEKRLGCR